MTNRFIFFFFFTLTSFLFCQTQTSEFSEQALTGREIWQLGDQSFQIEGTGLLEGRIFIVRVLYDEMPSQENYDDALKIAQFALVKGYRNNAKNFRFLDQFSEVSMEHIGVALIYQNGLKSTGYRFMFQTEEVLGEKYKEGIIEIPHDLTSDYSVEAMGEKYWQYLKNKNTEAIYDQFIPEVMAQLSKEDFLVSIEELYKYVKPLEYKNFSHSLFLGNNMGGRLFNYFYWVEENDSKGFLTLTLIDRDDEVSVIGLNINVNSFYQ
ncbi:MAG: hypothetical protein PQJ60_06245 [Spirochaetales bacterium]|nr:hypothetical protein [Spirochaetales bacterium]